MSTIPPAPGMTLVDQFSYTFAENRSEYIAKMAAAGRAPVFPQANQLQIDIDTQSQLDVFARNSAIFDREMKEDGHVVYYERHVSNSGHPHYHITVTLPFNVDRWQRIAMQAALGSDPVRELLSSMRCIRGIDQPTLFMEPK